MNKKKINKTNRTQIQIIFEFYVLIIYALMALPNFVSELDEANATIIQIIAIRKTIIPPKNDL